MSGELEDAEWDDKYRKALGARLQKAREYVGLTQEGVAKALGVSRPVVAHFEAGRHSVPAETLTKLCGIYMVPAEDVLVGPQDDGAAWMAPILRAVEPLSAADRGEVLDFARFLHGRRRARKAKLGESGEELRRSEHGAGARASTR